MGTEIPRFGGTLGLPKLLPDDLPPHHLLGDEDEVQLAAIQPPVVFSLPIQ
jgi:hypothetical protein